MWFLYHELQETELTAPISFFLDDWDAISLKESVSFRFFRFTLSLLMSYKEKQGIYFTQGVINSDQLIKN